MPNSKKVVKIDMNSVKKAENQIRDLINLVKVYNEEEIEAGEGKKIEDDTAEELIDKLRNIAETIGIEAFE
jgi:intracellular sulfur oxidation DsrE/DsrF family protein